MSKIAVLENGSLFAYTHFAYSRFTYFRSLYLASKQSWFVFDNVFGPCQSVLALSVSGTVVECTGQLCFGTVKECEIIGCHVEGIYIVGG